jgi:uncharacterized membrane protein
LNGGLVIEAEAGKSGEQQFRTTTSKLAATLGCSKSTVHKNLQLLSSLGIIERQTLSRVTRITLLRRRGEFLT